MFTVPHHGILQSTNATPNQISTDIFVWMVASKEMSYPKLFLGQLIYSQKLVNTTWIHQDEALARFSIMDVALAKNSFLIDWSTISQYLTQISELEDLQMVLSSKCNSEANVIGCNSSLEPSAFHVGQLRNLSKCDICKIMIHLREAIHSRCCV